ncbi:DUF418 domain-containing protein [Aeribacillus pallidus]|jgi:uncharacterized protein|uniref:DUF418 domain-containing protein n=1 Tax=Aeribacillus pallidus TaxID=33936 RepID=UPI003D20E3D3
MNHLKPLQTNERILSLDVIRGMSLLGIFLVNILSFHSPIMYTNPYEWWDYGDSKVFRWIDILVQGSFYPLFAMMFGMGLYMLYERSIKRGVPFYSIATRRLLMMLLIGILHVTFVWFGDILITYALIGLFTILFIKVSPKALLWTSGLLFFLINGLLFVSLYGVSLVNPYKVTIWTDIENVKQSIEVYTTGSFMEITRQRWMDWYYVNGPQSIIMLVSTIFPFMLFGAAVGKYRWVEKVVEWRTHWGITSIICMTIGFLLKMTPYVFEGNYVWMYVQDIFGGPILAIGYGAFIVWMVSFKPIHRFGHPFAATGKMSLTNYLTQSIVSSIIFYSYGLGLYGNVSLSTCVFIVISIYLMQVVASEWWLWKFQRGPMEWLWRLVTYRQRIPLKKG